MAANLTADASVVVASLSDWHELQTTCRRRLDDVEWLPAQVIAESVSILSRLPGGLAVPLDVAIAAVAGTCQHARQLRADRYLAVLSAIARAGLGGGAAYDALIGATARDHDATLLTLDRRAQRTYAAVGASFEIVG